MYCPGYGLFMIVPGVGVYFFEAVLMSCPPGRVFFLLPRPEEKLQTPGPVLRDTMLLPPHREADERR